jgi:hypothetical protein
VTAVGGIAPSARGGERERNTGQGETAEKTQSIANAPDPKIPKTKNLEGESRLISAIAK